MIKIHQSKSTEVKTEKELKNTKEELTSKNKRTDNFELKKPDKNTKNILTTYSKNMESLEVANTQADILKKTKGTDQIPILGKIVKNVRSTRLTEDYAMSKTELLKMQSSVDKLSSLLYYSYTSEQSFIPNFVRDFFSSEETINLRKQKEAIYDGLSTEIKLLRDTNDEILNMMEKMEKNVEIKSSEISEKKMDYNLKKMEPKELEEQYYISDMLSDMALSEGIDVGIMPDNKTVYLNSNQRKDYLLTNDAKKLKEISSHYTREEMEKIVQADARGNQERTKYLANIKLEEIGISGDEYLGLNYVISKDGEVYGSNGINILDGRKGQLNHSSYLAGQPVLGAGFIHTNMEGKVTYINNDSGHYKPILKQLLQSVLILDSQGMLDENALMQCRDCMSLKTKDVLDFLKNGKKLNTIDATDQIYESIASVEQFSKAGMLDENTTVKYKDVNIDIKTILDIKNDYSKSSGLQNSPNNYSYAGGLFGHLQDVIHKAKGNK